MKCIFQFHDSLFEMKQEIMFVECPQSYRSFVPLCEQLFRQLAVFDWSNSNLLTQPIRMVRYHNKLIFDCLLVCFACSHYCTLPLSFNLLCFSTVHSNVSVERYKMQLILVYHKYIYQLFCTCSLLQILDNLQHQFLDPRESQVEVVQFMVLAAHYKLKIKD